MVNNWSPGSRPPSAAAPSSVTLLMTYFPSLFEVNVIPNPTFDLVLSPLAASPAPFGACFLEGVPASDLNNAGRVKRLVRCKGISMLYQSERLLSAEVYVAMEASLGYPDITSLGSSATTAALTFALAPVLAAAVRTTVTILEGPTPPFCNSSFASDPTSPA